jgi:hypothetical protein
LGTNHVVSIVLFARVLYDSDDVLRLGLEADPTLFQLSDGVQARDFYKVILPLSLLSRYLWFLLHHSSCICGFCFIIQDVSVVSVVSVSSFRMYLWYLWCLFHYSGCICGICDFCSYIILQMDCKYSVHLYI